METSACIIIRFFDDVPPLVYLSRCNYHQQSQALGLLAFSNHMVTLLLSYSVGRGQKERLGGDIVGGFGQTTFVLKDK